MNALNVVAAISLLSGAASAYAPGVMERSVRNHTRMGHLSSRPADIDGLITLADCSKMNDVVYVRAPGTGWERVWVADCASKTDRQSETDDRSGYEWMMTEGIIAELQWGRWEEYKALDADLSDGVQIEVAFPYEWADRIPF